jgi:protein SCO1/2
MKIGYLFLTVFCASMSDGAETAASPKVIDDCCAVTLDTGPLSSHSLYQTEVGFTNDCGESFNLVALRGRPVVLTMFFASCSHACPMLVTVMQQMRDALPADLANPPVFVLISFDVERDTPEVLAQFRASRLLDDRWEVLHGDNDAVRELAALLGVKYQAEAGGGFSHSNVISILNSEGEVVHQRMGLMGSTDEAQRVLGLVSGTSKSAPKI